MTINSDVRPKNASRTVLGKANQRQKEAMLKRTKLIKRMNLPMDKLRQQARSVGDVGMSKVAVDKRAKLKTYSEMR